MICDNKEDQSIYKQIADNFFKDYIMSTQTTKRKDNSLAELTRVVSELKELSSVQGKIIGQIVETLAVQQETSKLKEKEKPVRFVHQIPFGEIFHRIGRQGSYMRVKPTSYLLNSSLVSESLACGKSLVCHLDSSTVFFIEDETV